MIFHNNSLTAVLLGDCITSMRALEAGSVQTCVTSPPYFGLRDYGHEGQIGLEETPAAFVTKLVEVFREVRRVLRDDGTLWLNLGDSYNAYNGNRGVSRGKANGRHHEIMPGLPKGAGLTVPNLKNKDLIGIPWRVAFALQADGWYLRQEIIWQKPNPMPESVTDRCTKAHEQIFLLSKSERYYFDHVAMKEPAVGGLAGNIKPTKAGRAYEAGATEHRTSAGLHKSAERQRRRVDSPVVSAVPGATEHSGLHRAGSEREPETRNRRSVWTVSTRPYKGAHFATFPPELIEPCVLAGSRPGDTVLDPFGGSGTTAGVALKHGRHAMLCELNEDYAALIPARVKSIVEKETRK